MKTKSTSLYILRLAMTLLLVTGIVGAALAGVNAITAPIIAGITAQKTQAAIEAVLPGGGEEITDFSDPTGLVQAAYRSDIGYAVQVAPKGFGGEIVIMVGVDKAGKILGIDVISHSETAGLGDVAASSSAKGEAFRNQFSEQDAPFAVGGNIDAITSATITSKAVTAGVNAAVEFVKSLD